MCPSPAVVRIHGGLTVPRGNVGNLIFQAINKRMRLCPPHKKPPAGQRARRLRFSWYPQPGLSPSTFLGPPTPTRSPRKVCGLLSLPPPSPNLTSRGPHAQHPNVIRPWHRVIKLLRSRGNSSRCSCASFGGKKSGDDGSLSLFLSLSLMHEVIRVNEGCVDEEGILVEVSKLTRFSEEIC